MFTGIVEEIAEVIAIKKEGSNLHLTIKSKLSKSLKIDQSVAHNGVCLTVVKKDKDTHTVTAIKETLDITTLSQLKKGTRINLERAMQAGARLDGHMVQGHVDQTAIVTMIVPENGSWNFHFEFVKKPLFSLVDKGSVCIDGTSLTVVKASKNKFQVSIIPYTFEHTIFSTYAISTAVNIEFDIIGKYVERLLKLHK
ncbi:MAG TPA: riboflavin synthase [Chitinophagales bacterium]|nr:riboflavin synthase [Chitinophagales bacterium]HMW12209.1 riboflavin synthase [Chitinophagales bacterium]HMX60332.1 riboflavin synthase [Chitinophagales bacterium]HMY23893.1 riboflavin synthase [Chitinophagales bacterium]HMZ33210.1 riboflavin synthase [Chitinophagales bacterium]